MKVILAGGRDVTKTQWEIAMYHLKLCDCVVTEVVSGKCPTGADHWGEEWAKAWGIPIKPFPADWDRYDKAAGPIRNREMAEYGDLLLAVWDGKSDGTRNMMKEMKRVKKPYLVYRLDTKEIESFLGPYSVAV